jgi:hypothetical protein
MLPDAAAPRHIDPPRRRFNIGLAIALQAAISAGDGLALIALANRVYQGTHASWAVAAVFLAITVPITALAPVAGLMLDRLPTRPVLLTAAGVEALIALALARLTGVPATLGLAAGFGVCAAVLQPGLGAIVPRIVGGADITRTNSYLQAATWGGFTVGPLLAGLLIATAGSGAALVADGALYALGAIGLWVLQLSPRTVTENGAEDRPSLSVQLRAGLSFLRADTEAGLLVATIGAMTACADMAVVADVVFAEHVLGSGPGGYSLLVAAWTGGMVIGTLAGGRLPERWLVPAALAGILATGAGVALAGWPLCSGRPRRPTASPAWPAGSRPWRAGASSTCGRPGTWPAGSSPCTRRCCSVRRRSAWPWPRYCCPRPARAWC